MIPDTRAMLHEPIAQIDELDDDTLIVLVRGGDTEAFAALYDRYVYSARRLARHLGQREESDDVVSDAFARILDLMQRGKGPDRAFRAYLFTTIRHESGRRAKAVQRVRPTDDDQSLDSPVAFGGGDLDGFEKATIRAAYESLPERWRTVLWHLDVEGRKPAELAEILDMSPNSVSALVYRARAGLRSAYLQAHVGQAGSAGPVCDDIRPRLAAVVRRTASAREQETVHAHLATCDACMAAHLELTDVNRDVGLVALPVATSVSLLGAAALAHAWLAGKGVALAVGSLAVSAAAVTGVTLAHQEPALAPAPAATAQVVAGAAAPVASGTTGTGVVPSSAPAAPRAGAPDAVSVAPVAPAPASAPSGVDPGPASAAATPATSGSPASSATPPSRAVPAADLPAKLVAPVASALAAVPAAVAEVDELVAPVVDPILGTLAQPAQAR